MYFVYVGSGGVMTAGTDWMSYGSELEEGLLDDDRGLDGDCFVFFYPVFKTMYSFNPSPP